MRDIHELALSIADSAAECLTQGDNVEVSVLNYGVTKRELPGVLRILRADPRFAEVAPTGFLGYIRFKKPIFKLV